jgi:hypothetical protein
MKITLLRKIKKIAVGLSKPSSYVTAKRSRREICLPKKRTSNTTTITNPIPPNWINANNVICPKIVKVVLVVTTVKPVTVEAEVAVKNASPTVIREVVIPGSKSSIVPLMINNAKAMINRPATGICWRLDVSGS